MAIAKAEILTIFAVAWVWFSIGGGVEVSGGYKSGCNGLVYPLDPSALWL